MRLHYFQHVWFEGLGAIKDWAEREGFEISHTEFFNQGVLPKVKDIDWLVVMGGPMGIYEEEEYSWLKEEKGFIRDAINRGKTVLGICLGAQLIADVLGAKVYRNKYKEIGWFKVKRALSDFTAFPGEFTAFHWHGDTFDIPKGAKRIAESKACPNQAFSYNQGKVIALQFHLETVKEGAERLVEQCGGEITPGDYIQRPEEILGKKKHIEDCNIIMEKLLIEMEKRTDTGKSAIRN